MKYDGIYCMYLRKSREDIELEKYDNIDTLTRHEKILTDFANKNGIKIGHIYREVVSGESIAERDEVQKMLADVENRKWNGTLVMEVERIARGDTTDQGIVANAFKYSHTKIVTPIKTYDPDNEYDEEYFEFGLFMSRREYKTINRRLQRGRLTSVSEGKYVGSVPPFGYKRKKLDNDKGFTLESNPEEAEIVKQIFNLYAYQETYINGVVKTINDMGLKPRKTEKWSISTIKDILSNPVYIGIIRWNARKQEVHTENGKKVKSRPRNTNKDDIINSQGLHEPLIDKETWDIVQSKRSHNSPSVQHNNTIQNPLVGIVYCEKCGKSMQRRPYTSKSKEPTLLCPNPDCDNISSKQKIVEDKIIDALRIWLKSYTIDYDELSKLKRSTKILTDKDLLQQLEKSLDKENKKLLKIYDLFEDNTYSKQEFEDRSINAKNNIKQLEDKIKPLKEKIEMQENAIEQRQTIIPKIENVIDIYDKLQTSEEKNMLLKTILEKVTYLKTEKAIKKISDPTNFEIHIYPKLPRCK